MFRFLALALALLATSAAGEECVVLTNNLVNACQEVSAGLWGADMVPLGVGAPGTTCAAITAGVAKVFGGIPTRMACCDAARAFAVQGCVCNPEVIDMTEGMGRLPRGTDVPTYMAGIMALTQASDCSLPTYGGPILDACTGGVGACGGPAFPTESGPADPAAPAAPAAAASSAAAGPVPSI